MKDFNEDFLKSKNITKAEFEAMDSSEMANLYAEYSKEQLQDLSTKLKDLEAKGASKADVTAVEKQMVEIDKTSKAILTKLEEQGAELIKLQERGTGVNVNTIKQAVKTNKEAIDNVKDKRVSFEVKSFGYANISGRDELTPVEAGNLDKPFRKQSVVDIFKRKPINKEYFKYRETNTVTRDAKVVVACAPSVHSTGKDWIIRTVELAKIREWTEVCQDMMDDYDFVEGEIKDLVKQGVNSKEEQELLGTGDGTNNTYTSIDVISSEFSADNALAPFTKSFKTPTLAELTDAMKAQISVFGQNNSWNADTILMNYSDFVKYKHEKNANGDYLIPNYIDQNGQVLNGMRIVTSPLISANTLYVFDSTKGTIYDRQKTEVTMSYDNKDNFEHEMVTIKALKRSQLIVKNINRDAFMKCTDIASSLTAITKV